MSASCKVIAEAIERLAPLELAEDWDNVGLLVGSPEHQVTKVLLTLDVTEEVIDEAVALEAGLIISHHPCLFHPVKNICTDTMTGFLLKKLIKMDMSVYAAHTNLDAAAGGVNDALAAKLQLNEVVPLRPVQLPLVKIVTYVPPGHWKRIWQAMTDAGAGHIGKYSHCGFRVAGTGTFLPGAEARPFIGEPHQLSEVDEIRLETVAPASLSDRIVHAMLATHPYEEVAYDLYPLQNSQTAGGVGRVGNLLHPVTLSEFATRVKEFLSLTGVRFVGKSDSLMKRIAVCGGAGAGVAAAARLMGADVLVTGDIRYHEAMNELAEGLCLIDGGHFGTEFPTMIPLQRYLSDCSASGGWNCQFFITQKQSDIWQWI